jgi:tetratricopeptide (TPR) repeat protein
MKLYNNIGILAGRTRNYELGMEYFKKSLKLKPMKSITVSLYFNLALSNLLSKDYPLAKGYFKKAAILYKELSENNQVLECYCNLCLAEYYQKHYQKAEDYANDVINKAKEQNINYHYTQGTILLAMIYIAQEKFDYKIYNKAIAMCNENLNKERTADFYNVYSDYLYKKNEYQKAMEYKYKYIEIYEKANLDDFEDYKKMLYHTLKFPVTNKLVNQEKASDIPDGFTFNFLQKTFFIMYSEVMYFEILNHYVNIYLINGQKYRFKGTISGILQKLDSRFLQIHRAFVINMNHIITIGEKIITLSDGQRVPCSKNMKMIQKIYLKWMNEK